MGRRVAAGLACGLVVGLLAAILFGRHSAAAVPDRNAVLVDARGKVDRSFPDLALYAAVADGRGGWFVGGGLPESRDALRSGDVVRYGLARMRADGTLDPNWTASLPPRASVWRLARAGSRLFAFLRHDHGGNELVALDAASGRILWRIARFKVPHTGDLPVHALAATPSTLYVGGAFFQVGDADRTAFAALDAATGRVLAWQPSLRTSAVPPSPSADALGIVGHTLYVGGVFDRADGSVRRNLAAFELPSGRLSPWRARPIIGDVDSVTVTHGMVFTSGYDGAGILDATTGRGLPLLGRIAGVVGSVAAAGPILYLGSGLKEGMTAVDGKPRENLAAFDVHTNRFTDWAPRLARYVDVAGITVSGGRVLVYGRFLRSIG